MTVLNLTNIDGNAFSILGEASKVARRAGWSKEEINAYTNEAMEGDYSNLLAVTMEYFEVTMGNSDDDADMEMCDRCGDTMLFCTCEDDDNEEDN